MPPKCGVVILAAGTASRMGQQKLLLPLGNRPLLDHVLSAVTKDIIWDDCIAIIGEPQSELATICHHHKVRYVYNKQRLTGQASSIVLGLQHLAPDLDGVFFVVGDQPFLSSLLLLTMIRRFVDVNDKQRIVVPYCSGQSYNPVLFGSYWRQTLTRLTGDQGGRVIIWDNPLWVTPVDWENPHTFYDADTWEEYQRLCAEWQHWD